MDCERDFISGVLELITERTLCGFHYFTSKKTRNMKIVEELSRDDVKLLLEYRERYGKWCSSGEC